MKVNLKKNETEEKYKYANEYKDIQSLQENGKGGRESLYMSYCLVFIVKLVIHI